MKRLSIFLTIFFATTAACGDADDYTPQNGDIIFHVSRSEQSPAIQVVTGSPYSHMGIVHIRDGNPFVFEAVGPVKQTPLGKWISFGVRNHFVVKRLRNADVVINSEALRAMLDAGRDFVGLPYDLRFEWSDDRIYCSELVWKIYHRGLGIRLTEFETVSDFDLGAPEVRTVVESRWPEGLPTNQRVVSPAAIFASEHLVTVFEN
jgi:uncharacterized protein YycO